MLYSGKTVVWTADNETLSKVNDGELTLEQVRAAWQERERAYLNNLSQPQAAVPKASSAPPSEQPAICIAVTYAGVQSELRGCRHCTKILIF